MIYGRSVCMNCWFYPALNSTKLKINHSSKASPSSLLLFALCFQCFWALSVKSNVNHLVRLSSWQPATVFPAAFSRTMLLVTEGIYLGEMEGDLLPQRAKLPVITRQALIFMPQNSAASKTRLRWSLIEYSLILTSAYWASLLFRCVCAWLRGVF